MLRRIHQGIQSSSASLYPRQRLVDVLGTEKHRIEGIVTIVDSANRDFKIDRINRSFDDHFIADLPAMFLSQRSVHRRAGSIALKGFQLIGRNAVLFDHIEDFIWIDSKLSKSVLWFCVFIDSAKPIPWTHMHHARNGADFFAVIGR